jgi:hypothetical protein
MWKLVLANAYYKTTPEPCVTCSRVTSAVTRLSVKEKWGHGKKDEEDIIRTRRKKKMGISLYLLIKVSLLN